MKNDCIIIGDIVNVTFISDNELYDCEVIYTPSGVGDCWTLKDKKGTIHNVLLYSRMSKVKESLKSNEVREPRGYMHCVGGYSPTRTI